MVTCLTSYLGQARIRDVTCCVSPLPRELYAEEEFDCLQIEEHLSRHVTPCRRKGKCFVFFFSTVSSLPSINRVKYNNKIFFELPLD